MLKILIPRDNFEDLLNPECVDWLRSRPDGVPEAGMEGSQLWLGFSDAAVAADFAQLWLCGKRLAGVVQTVDDEVQGRAA